MSSEIVIGVGNLEITTPTEWDVNSDPSEKGLTMKVKTEMYQGDYVAPGTTTGFNGETTLSTRVVSGNTTSSDGAGTFSITVDFTEAVGVSNGMKLKAESKGSSAGFGISTGGSTKAIINLSLENKTGTSVIFGGKVKITVEVPNNITPVTVVYDGTEGGQPTSVTGVYNSGTNSTTVTFVTTHFSDFVVSSGVPMNNAKEYCIYDAEQLFVFAKTVNSGRTYSGETVNLMEDIDLEWREWTPIGIDSDTHQKEFQGSFEGNGKVISNLMVNLSKGYSSAGLFGAISEGAEIKDFSIVGAKIKHVTDGKVDGDGNPNQTSNGIAVVVGSAQLGKLISGITVSDAEIDGNRRTAGIVGYCLVDVSDCHVENIRIIATPESKDEKYDNGDKAGAIAGYVQGQSGGYRTIDRCTAKDVTITAYRDAGILVGYLNQYSVLSNSSISGDNLITIDRTNHYFDDGNVEFSARIGDYAGVIVENAEIRDCEKETDVEKIFLVHTIDEFSMILNKWADFGMNGITAKLTNDLNVSSAEWTVESVNRVGNVVHVDGNNYSITGLTSALLGYGGDSKIIVENLTLVNCSSSGKFAGANSGCGAIVNSANNELTITNCHINNPNMSHTMPIGGFVGFLQNQSKAVITNCTIDGGSISGGRVGGFIGSMAPATEATIESCDIITTQVSGTEYVGAAIGLILGEAIISDFTNMSSKTDLVGSNSWTGSDGTTVSGKVN